MMAVTVAMRSLGQTIWAMMDEGMMTPPTPMEAKVTIAYIADKLWGVERETRALPNSHEEVSVAFFGFFGRGWVLGDWGLGIVD